MLVTLLAVAATAVSATSYNFHKGPKTEVFDVNLDGQADGPQPGAKPIYYQSYGARVIDQPANINLIWYGNWTQSQRGIINDFLDNLGYNDCTSAATTVSLIAFHVDANPVFYSLLFVAHIYYFDL
eukprot:jgi/Hompol1/5892/HPOL_004773-RA